MDRHVFGFPGPTSGSNLIKLVSEDCQIVMPRILSLLLKYWAYKYDPRP